jgi:uncharacterized cupin superfamily protein
MGLTHFEDAPRRPIAVGHLGANWTFLGEHAGSRTIGLRRLEIDAGRWSTPAHEHGRSEEIYYVLSGRGVAWLGGNAAEVRTGDCVVCSPRRGAHTLHALEPLDVLAFGPREYDESPRYPRLGYSLLGGRWVQSAPGSIDGTPVQFVEEAKLGPPELPAEPAERPRSIVNVADVEPEAVEHGRVARSRRNLGRAAGSITTGLQHVEVPPGRESVPLHCHSREEELFVVLDGDGALVLNGGEDTGETPVREASVVSRPAGTAVAHMFRAGDRGLTYIAYGTRDTGDICYYPRSQKVSFRGLGLIARIERLDYWDGED